MHWAAQAEVLDPTCLGWSLGIGVVRWLSKWSKCAIGVKDPDEAWMNEGLREGTNIYGTASLCGGNFAASENTTAHSIFLIVLLWIKSEELGFTGSLP